MRKFLQTVWIAPLLLSCGEADQTSAPQQTWSPAAPLPAFRPTCSPDDSVRAPAPGTTFVYEIRTAGQAVSADRIRETVLSSDRDRATVGLSQFTGEQRLNSSEATRLLGLVPAEARSIHYWRRYELGPEAAQAILDLSVGETESWAVGETTDVTGEETTSAGTFEVTLLGCGSYEVNGREWPTRVYRVSTFFTSVDREDRVSQATTSSVFEYLPDIGWWASQTDGSPTSGQLIRVEEPS